MAAIEVRNLVVSYGEKKAVSGLDLSCSEGEILCLLGPNGAGKTTTVETIEGYKKPSSGSVRVLDMDPIKDKRALSSKIGVMLQKGGIYPRMSVGDSLELYAGFYQNPQSPKDLAKILDLTALWDTKYRRLSGGEAQRLSLALSIIGNPCVVFLDEPTAGVDPEGRLVIRQMIKQLAENGASVLLTTHELGEAEKLADNLVIISSGKKIAEGSLASLRDRFDTGGIRFSARSLDTTQLKQRLGVEIVEVRPTEFKVIGEATPARIAELTSLLSELGVDYGSLSTEKTGLEEIYLDLVAAHDDEDSGSLPPITNGLHDKAAK